MENEQEGNFFVEDQQQEMVGEFEENHAIEVKEEVSAEPIANGAEHPEEDTNGTTVSSASKPPFPSIAGVKPSPAVAAPPPLAPVSGGLTAKMKAILDRTGYAHQVTNLQHVYGPPPGKENDRLPAGVQVHVGRISWTAMEEDLIEVFEKAGEIYELRLMLDPKAPGKNKGFCFVTFCTKQDADNAVKMFNNYPINGKNISVTIASPNNTLFIGSIPKTKGREEIQEMFSEIVEGLVDVLLQPALQSAGTSDKNRGFCFLNFEDYKSAVAARAKLRLREPLAKWGDYRHYTCDWADPVEEVSEEVMATVKTLFVKNISERTTEMAIRERFAQYGSLDKVVVHRHYAFVFFSEREPAMRAIDGENGKVLVDTAISVELAKPVSDEHKKKILELKEKRNEHVGGRTPGRGGGFGDRRGHPPGMGPGNRDPYYPRRMPPPHPGRFGGGPPSRGSPRGGGMGGARGRPDAYDLHYGRGRVARGGAPLRPSRGATTQPPPFRGGTAYPPPAQPEPEYEYDYGYSAGYEEYAYEYEYVPVAGRPAPPSPAGRGMPPKRTRDMAPPPFAYRSAPPPAPAPVPPPAKRGRYPAPAPAVAAPPHHPPAPSGYEYTYEYEYAYPTSGAEPAAYEYAEHGSAPVYAEMEAPEDPGAYAGATYNDFSY